MSESNANDPVTPKAAIEQAAESLGVLAGVDLDLGGGRTWRLPNPALIPRDMKRRHRELQRFLTYELDKKKVKHPVTGKLVEQTEWPWKYDGVEIDEDELLCIALMSQSDKGIEEREAYFKDGTLPDTYQQFLDADGVAGLVQFQWTAMNQQMEDRAKRDPKSR